MASSASELLLQALPQLAGGAAQTLAISALGIVFATLGGVLYGVLATLGNRALNIVLQVYLELFRAIPVLVWLYLVFFGLPIFFALSIPSFWCAVLVLALWGASEVGEVVRGALASLPRGQREAGLSIGLAGWQLYGYVLLPQALKRMTPPTINIYTRIIKTSSLAVLIYGALFLFFFIVCYPLSAASRVLERRWAHS